MESDELENFGRERGVIYTKEIAFIQGISIFIYTVTHLFPFLKFPGMKRADFLFTSCPWLALLRDFAIFQTLNKAV